MGSIFYVTSKIDNKKYCKTNGQFTRHLRNNNLTYQEYYEKYVTGIQKKCSCSKPLTFYQSTETYAKSCGDPICVGLLVHITKSNWSDEQRKADSDSKKKWTADRTKSDIEKTKEIRKKTNRERYGVDHTTQSTAMKEKSKLTKKIRYGDENYSNPKLKSKSWKEKTDCEIIEITNKRQRACLERYGVSSPFFLPNVRNKSAIANSIGKEFIFPSGKIIRVRGYEDVVITKLLEHLTEEQIIVDNILSDFTLPVFIYGDNKKRKYYPDIYIPHENKIIEVKGRWWWDGNGIEKYKNRLDKNLKKRQSVLTSGYNYEVWLFEDNKTYRILKDDTDFN